MLERGAPAGGLSAREMSWAIGVADRLGQELMALLEHVPRSGASALSLSRDLKVERNLCHRVCAALSERDSPTALLSRMPGPGSLRAFVNAAARKSGMRSRAEHQAALAAVDQFAELIRSIGGTQTRMNARLAASGQAASGQAATQDPAGGAAGGPRQAIFEAARQVTGAWYDAVVALLILRPSSEPGKVAMTGLSAHIGLRAERAPVPFTPWIRYTPADPAGEVGMVQRSAGGDGAEAPAGVVRAFSSDPLPRTQRRSNAEGAVMYVVEPGATGPAGADLVILDQTVITDPRLSTPRTQSFFRRSRFPARLLMLDLYVHRSIRVSGGARISAVHGFYGMTRDALHAWQERLPDTPLVQMLGAGLDAAGIAEWPRYTAAAAHAFDASGDDPSAFIGFRCRAPYPYWGATYTLDVDLEPS